jgi:hypothetical protein
VEFQKENEAQPALHSLFVVASTGIVWNNREEFDQNYSG